MVDFVERFPDSPGKVLLLCRPIIFFYDIFILFYQPDLEYTLVVMKTFLQRYDNHTARVGLLTTLTSNQITVNHC